MQRTKNTIVLAAILLAAVTLAANAAEIIKPEIGEPLRDAAVTRGPDGTWYLTGTRAMGREWRLRPDAPKYAADRYVLSESLPRRRPDGSPDFLDNDGVRLWSSKDLVNWKDEGLVWDLMALPGGSSWDNWRGRRWAHPERKVGEPLTRAVTSPRFLFHRGNWYLGHSMCGHDFGLMQSRDDRIQGPYRYYYKQPDGRVKWERNSVGPGYGSLFVDSDGAVYKVWGPGFMVRMKDDLSNTADGAEDVDLLAQVEGYPNAEWCARQFAPRAASLFLDGDTYLLVWSAMTDVDGVKREDSFVATASGLMGPYSEPRLLVPGSGPAVIFDGGERGLMLSCSMDNAPVLIPLRLQGGFPVAQGISVPIRQRPALPGELKMYDYANSRPSGKWHQPDSETGRSSGP